jgi:enoyl-CoA hydratase/carnithine racemase
VFEVAWGLIPDMTGTQLLPELVGRDVAKELTYTARIVSGEEAVRIGLATRTDPDPLAAALAMAKEIAGRSPHAIRAAKRLLDLAGRPRCRRARCPWRGPVAARRCSGSGPRQSSPR